MARDDPELVLDVNGSKQYKRLSNKHMLLDAEAAVEALPRVIDLMARELSWSRARKDQEREDARKFLATMYVPVDDGKTAQDVVDAVIARGANRKLTRQLTRLDTTKVIEPAK